VAEAGCFEEILYRMALRIEFDLCSQDKWIELLLSCCAILNGVRRLMQVVFGEDNNVYPSKT